MEVFYFLVQSFICVSKVNIGHIKHLFDMLIQCWGFRSALKLGVSIQPCLFQRPFEFPLFMFVVWSKLHGSRVPPSMKCIWTKNNARPPFRFFRSVCKLTIGNWCSKKYKNMLLTVNFETFNKSIFIFFGTFSQKCKGAQNCTSWISFKHFAAVFSLLATNDVWKDLKTLQILKCQPSLMHPPPPPTPPES